MTDRIIYEEDQTTPLQRVEYALKLAINVIPVGVGARTTIQKILDGEFQEVKRSVDRVTGIVETPQFARITVTCQQCGIVHGANEAHVCDFATQCQRCAKNGMITGGVWSLCFVPANYRKNQCLSFKPYERKGE